jgi:hypothetical protein
MIREYYTKDGLSHTEEVPDPVLPLNWLGLEQALYKSELFTKYFSDYNSRGLLLTATIQNGKRGEDVNEQTLLLGFSALGIAWLDAEKTLLNQILTDNNFSIQI